MIKSYLGLLIFFAVHHQVSSLSADVDHRKHTQKIRKDRTYMMKELQNIQRRSEIRQDPIDNYDLIVTEPPKTSIKSVLRHRHRHHRFRSGGGAKVRIKNYNTHKPLKDANTLRKQLKVTGETNVPPIQEYKNSTTKNDLNEYQRGGENVTTTHVQKDKDVATENGLNEHGSGRENEATTLMQKDKDDVTKNSFNESRRRRENKATTQIQEDRDTTTKNYLYKNHSGRVNESTTQIHKDKDAITTNYLIENWREGEKIATMSQKPVNTIQKVTPKVPFYRRVNYLDDQERNKPQKWVHCLDLLGPRLKGYKDNWRPKEMTNRNTDIKRLGELLNTDVSQYNEAEIISLLSQISNIDIRLFQWDYTALTTIINVIIRGSVHSFRTLKAGVKYMFARWHLDISMLQTFLEQTRIFRPPCIDISGSSGYTKKAGGILLFTKPDKSTKKHRGGDESCQSRETTTVNNNK